MPGGVNQQNQNPPIMNNNDNVNQKNLEQVVGTGSDSPIPPFARLATALCLSDDSQWAFSMPSLLAPFTDSVIPRLERHDMFPPKRMSLIRKWFELKNKHDSKNRIDKSDWDLHVEVDLRTVFADLSINAHYTSSQRAPVEISGPRAVFPQPELSTLPEDDDAPSTSHNPGPSRIPANKPVRATSPTSLHSTVKAPIYDLDNKKVAKKLASYKKKVKVKTPKAKREELISRARNAKNLSKDPMRNMYDYESQMFRLPRVEVVHSIDSEVTATVTRVMEGFQDMLLNSGTTAAEVSQAFKASADNFTEKMANSGNNLSEAISSGVGSLMKVLWYVPFVGISYYAITTSNAAQKQALLVGLTTAMAVVLPGGLWDKIKPYFPTITTTWAEQAHEAQFGFTPSNLAHIMTLAMSFFTIGKTDAFGVTKDFMKTLPHYSRTVSGWKDLTTFIINLIEGFVNTVRVAFGADRMQLFKTGLSQVDNWCTRVMEVMNESNTGEKVFTPENVRLIQALRNEGADLTNLYRLDSSIAPVLHKYLSYLDEICLMCSAAMHSSKGARSPPVVIMLSGKPGTGKTLLVDFLATDILTAILPKSTSEDLNKDLSSQIFQKGSSEYWNGYCGQKIVVVDDFAQSVAVPGEDNDYINLIRMANRWPFPLNFADLQNKGKNFFDSDAIILTTNLSSIDSCQSVILEPGAITRRIDYGYDVTVAPDYRLKDGKLDYAKLMQVSEARGQLAYEAWELRKKVFSLEGQSPVDYSQIYTLDQVMTDVKTRLTRNAAGHSTIKDLLRKLVTTRYESQMNLPKPKPEANDDFEDADEDFKPPPDYRAVNNLMTGLNWFFLEKPLGLWKDEFFTLVRMCELSYQNPIIRFLADTAVLTLIFTGLRYIIRKITGWFVTGVKATTETIKNALFKKKTIPEDCIAQMIDALRPSDFDVVKEVDGKYVTTKSFTKEVFQKVLDRMSSTFFPQSNEPAPKFLHRSIKGNRVIESDNEPQADFYACNIANTVYNNTYRLSIKSAYCDSVLGHILFYADTVGLMPLHYDFELQAALDAGHLDSAILTLRHSTSDLSYTFTLEEFLAFPRVTDKDKDVIAVKFPRSVRASKDISKLFVKDADLTSLKKCRVRLDTIDGDDHHIHRSRHVNAWRKDETHVSAPTKSYTVAGGFEYLAYTVVGDCGAPVMLEEAPEKQCRRIIGIHFAGRPTLGLGVSNVLTQEFLTRFLKAFDVQQDLLCEAQMGLEVVFPPVEGSFTPQNKSGKTHNMNPISCIVETPLHDAWGKCGKKPVPLRNTTTVKGKVYPMKTALASYATPVLQYREHEVARAAKHAMGPFNKCTLDHSRRIFTFEEAVAGIPGIFNGLPRGTSPGYPYVCDGHTNKKAFFGSGEDYDFSSDACQQLKVDVLQIVGDAKRNIRHAHIWIDFGKDECRSILRADLGQMRLISSCPLKYAIAYRMLFGSFNIAAQDTRIRNGIAIGINPYKEWDYLSKEMKAMGPYCVAGDFKAFDSSEQPDIHWAILDEINEWYSDDEELQIARAVLWTEVTHSRHLGGTEGKADTIYQWNKSLPSGHPATSIINSFYNLTIFNLVWTDTMGIEMASRFWDYIYACVYGDDNILNIHPDVIDSFNQHTIGEGMAKRGMVYTSEDKNTQVAKHRPLTEITFLKRGFRFEPLLNRYVGNQELDSILYIPYWCKNKAMLRDITEANLEFTYLELSLHPPDVWNEHAPIIRDSAKNIMGLLPQQLFRREEYLQLSTTRDTVWPL